MKLPLLIGRPRSLAALQAALGAGGTLVLAAQHEAVNEDPGPEDLYTVGVVCQVRSTEKQDTHGVLDGTLNAFVDALWRCSIERFPQTDPFYRVCVRYLPDGDERVDERISRRIRRLRMALTAEARRAGEGTPPQIDDRNVDPAVAALHGMPVGVSDRQAVLAETNPRQRAQLVMEILGRELAVAYAALRMRKRSEKQITDEDREDYLRKQKAGIERRLADLTGEKDDIEQLTRRLEEADLPADARQEADRELRRLTHMGRGAPQYAVAVTYLEWLADLPWNRSSETTDDLGHARAVLAADHYGRETIKERVIEHLAVQTLRKGSQGMLLCFVGAPGVGKTSFGRSIARATGREFCRIALGGVRDEAEIRGHRRTYVGAMPGRFVQALRRAKVKNPVFLLDEIDKVTAGAWGDPTAALLEVLDPELNSEFVDHYLGVQIDLSQALFVATANTTATIPPALLDRVEVIRLPGYSAEEKIEIATGFLIPRQLERTGLDADVVQIEREAVSVIIDRYTRESGVRNLERNLASLLRKTALRAAESPGPFPIGACRAVELLGPPPYEPHRIPRTDRPGSATGVAMTASGASPLRVELVRTAGEGKLTVTGKAGEVLQEAAQIVFGLVRSAVERLASYVEHRAPHVEYQARSAEQFTGSDYHLHFPAGAAVQEGAAAGLAIFGAFASLLTDSVLPDGLTLIGEVTLHGRILEVDALPERLVAAARAGARTAIVPEQNRRHLEDPACAHVAGAVRVVFCRTVWDAAAEFLSAGAVTAPR